MRRILWAALLILAACAPARGGAGYRSSASPVAVDELDRIAREVAYPTVLVRSSGGSGSGVVIYQDKKKAVVLTAAHVVVDGEGVIEPGIACLRGRSDGTMSLSSARVIKIDRNEDLCMLRTEPVWQVVAAPLMPQDLRSVRQFAPVLVCGHPLGLTDCHVTDGRISTFDDHGFMRYSAPTIFGNSGGPVFAEVGGVWTVISVCQRGYTTRDGQFVYHIGLGATPGALVNFLWRE